MMTIRNLGGISLLLAGSTWLWLTPAFAGRGIPTSGLLWDITRVLCLLTIAAFSVATWALFTRQGWWEAAALGSAVLGLVTLVPYWFADHHAGTGAGTVNWNVFVHVLMAAGVFVLLVVPELERWVNHHVMRG
jgi:hypothetical protein